MTLLHRVFRLTVLLAVLVGISGCRSTSKGPSTPDILLALTEDVIVPRFESVAMAMAQMEVHLQDLCNEPAADNLELARQSWNRARSTWMRAQALGFGPVMDRRSRSLVDWFPVDPNRIEDLLVTRESVTAEDVREYLSATQRGLGAIEYVLFQDDSTVLAFLDQDNALHCPYVLALADVAAVEMHEVLDAWQGTSEVSSSYAAKFTGTASASLLDTAAVAELVRTSVFLMRTITDMQLGKALGLDGNDPDPAAIPGGTGHYATSDLRDQVLGMQDIYLGHSETEGAGLGLSTLIHDLSPDVDENLKKAFEEVLASLDNLEDPLQLSVVQDPEPGMEAYNNLKELQRIWNTEVVSLLGVSVGFADTDGDSG